MPFRCWRAELCLAILATMPRKSSSPRFVTEGRPSRNWRVIAKNYQKLKIWGSFQSFPTATMMEMESLGRSIILSKSKTEDRLWWTFEWVFMKFSDVCIQLNFKIPSLQNSVPIAPKQASELKAIMSQFPVSSGKQHQKVENTWVPVTTSSTPATVTTVATVSKPILTLERQIQEQLPELAKPKPLPLEPPPPLHPALMKPYDWKSDDHYLSKTIVPELAPQPQVSFFLFPSRCLLNMNDPI